MIRRIACVAGVLFVMVSALQAVAPFPAYFTLPPAGIRRRSKPERRRELRRGADAIWR